MLLCDFNEKINNFLLDSITNQLYILLDNGVLLVVEPKVSSSNKDYNSCESKVKLILRCKQYNVEIC
jgi:hypothetical protein